MKNRSPGTFTNYTWGGGAENSPNLQKRLNRALPTTVDVMGLPGDEDFEKCRQMAKEMAGSFKEK